MLVEKQPKIRQQKKRSSKKYQQRLFVFHFNDVRRCWWKNSGKDESFYSKTSIYKCDITLTTATSKTSRSTAKKLNNLFSFFPSFIIFVVQTNTAPKKIPHFDLRIQLLFLKYNFFYDCYCCCLHHICIWGIWVVK